MDSKSAKASLLDCCILFLMFIQFSLLVMASDPLSTSSSSSSSLLSGVSLDKETNANQPHIEKKLNQLCRGVREIQHLSRMQELINLLKVVMVEKNYTEIQQSRAARSGWLCGLDSTCAGNSAYWHICADQAQAIEDLGPLLEEKENVCKSTHIDKIESYRNKHVRPHQVKPITYNFFYLYAAQVSITCKKNLLHSLSIVNQDVAKESYEKVVNWLAPFEENNNSCNREISKLALYQGDNEREHPTISTGRCCDSIRVFTKIKQIDEMVHQLGYAKGKGATKETNPLSSEEKQTATRQPSRISRELNKSPIPEHLNESIDEIRATCAKLEPIYTNTIVPIVRLAAMHVDPEYKEFEKKCNEEKLIQHWFIITLVCNSMLSCNLVKVPHLQNPPELNPVNSVQEQDSTMTKTGVLVPNEHEFLISNTLEDELWIKKYLPSRLSKLKTDFVKSIIKTFKIDEFLAENPNLKKGLKFGQNAVIGLTLVGLTIAGMDSDIFFN